MEISNSSVFLILYCGEDEQNKLLGVYNNQVAALSHKFDNNIINQYGNNVYVTEVGVRSKKSLRPLFERAIICK